MGKRRRRKRRTGFMRVLPYLLGGAAMVGYFVWICLEMASHADGGDFLPAAIFGAVLLGIITGGVSMIHRPRAAASADTAIETPHLIEAAPESTESRTASRSRRDRPAPGARRPGAAPPRARPHGAPAER